MKKKLFVGSIEKFSKKVDLYNKVIRYWIKEDLINDPECECEYGYITQVIKVNQNKTLIGIQAFDERYPSNKYTSINYYDINDLDIMYCPDDQEEENS